MSSLLWLEPVGGCAGDMTLAALLDLGVPLDAVTSGLDRLRLPGWSLEVGRAQNCGIWGTRVHVHVGDVHDLLDGRRRYDAILLDVDNGPDPFVQNVNERLYTRPGIHRIKAALAPGGRVIFWSAHPDKSFAKSLQGSFKNVECIGAKAYPKAKRFSHTLFVADRD